VNVVEVLTVTVEVEMVVLMVVLMAVFDEPARTA
jgi:hypothetical protein